MSREWLKLEDFKTNKGEVNKELDDLIKKDLLKVKDNNKNYLNIIEKD
jgi:hypothetical protein